ncbi:MAG TPA: tyrosine-type recombinase/integrase [Stellaceae bacterium]|nr:tyrosine-type recombinase/integrase [Stellaceae bacterium]
MGKHRSKPFITDPAQAITPGDHYFDPEGGGVEQLYIRVQAATRTRRWRARLRYKGERLVLLLGSPVEGDVVRYLTLGEARAGAHRLAAAAGLGFDPRGELPDQAVLTTKQNAELTFKDAVSSYLAHLDRRVRNDDLSRRYVDEETALLAGASSVVTPWNSRPIASIEWDDALKAFNRLLLRNRGKKRRSTIATKERGAAQVLRLQNTLGRLWTHVRKNQSKEPRLVNVFLDREPQGHVARRERVLDEADLALVLRAAENEGPAGEAIIFALHTGSRHKETVALPWRELTEGDCSEWNLDPRRANVKSDRKHWRPMPTQLTAMLQKIKARQLAAGWKVDFVFALTRTNKPLSTLQKAKERIVAATGIEDFTVHATKHTVGVMLARYGKVPPYIREHILNHKRRGVTASTYEHVEPEDRELVRRGMQNLANALDLMKKGDWAALERLKNGAAAALPAPPLALPPPTARAAE